MKIDELRWEQRQRLQLLEARIIWAGQLTSTDLREAFGISRSQASKDFSCYQALCPANLRYDLSDKCYRPTAEFEPVFLHGTAREFLQVLRNRGLLAGGPLSLVAQDVAPSEVLELPEREFDVRILQRVIVAIRERRWLQLSYQSMSHPEPRELRLAPLALAHAGRWHLRAWSEAHDAHRDFLLSRISGLPELDGLHTRQAKDDWDWQNYVAVRIGAHPELSEAQRKVVEADYGMQKGVYERNLRLALVPYYLRLLQVGGDDHRRPAAQQQIVLLNADELESYRRLR